MSSLDYALDSAEDSLEGNDAEHVLAVALLSSVSRHLLPELFDEVNASDFYDTNIGALWGAGAALLARGENITRRALIAEAGGTEGAKAQIKRFSGERVEFGRIRDSIDRVVELSKMRRLVQAMKRGAQYIETTNDGYSEALHFIHEQLADLSESKPSKDVKTFDELVEQWREQQRTPKEARRVFPTPWADMNDCLTGGLQPGRSYVIGGRPGEGKSVGLLNMAAHAAQNGHPTVVFSVEMGDVEVISRIIASGANAELGQLNRREIDRHNWQKIDDYLDTFQGLPLVVVDRSDITIDYIAAQCRTLKRRKEGLDVVVVDYLQLLRESDSRQTRERQVAQISRALKVLARDLDVAVLIACQLNRNSAGGDRKPALSDLRESGAIEQDADVVILLHHPTSDATRKGEVDLCIAKNRAGKLGTVAVAWRPHRASISDMGRG